MGSVRARGCCGRRALPGEQAGAPAVAALIAGLAVLAATPRTTLASDAAPVPLLEVLPPADAVPGWARAGEPQYFSADDLWRQIDGAADQYLLHGCTGMVVAYHELGSTGAASGASGSAGAPGTAAEPGSSTAEICVEIYEFADSLGAYGMATLERSQVEACLPLGALAYLAGGGAIHCCGGRYYAKVSPQPDGETGREAALALAERIAADHMRASAPPAEFALFPPEHLAEEPFGYAPRSALSLEGLDRALTAKYRSGAEEMVVHLVRAADGPAAEATYEKVRAALERRSVGAPQAVMVGSSPALRAELKYRGAALLLRHEDWVVVAAPMPAGPWGEETIEALLERLSR